MNGTGGKTGLALGMTPSLESQILDVAGFSSVQTARGDAADPAADRIQKRLLVDGLIRSAVLEPFRSISAEQQQRLAAAIGLDGGWQQIGDRRAGRGHHRHSPAGGCRHPEGEEGRRSLINRRKKLQHSLGRHQARRRRQGAGTAAWAEHQPPQPLTMQGVKQAKSRLEVGAGNRQCRRSPLQESCCSISSPVPRRSPADARVRP